MSDLTEARKEELKELLITMESISHDFYLRATALECHGFIEITGLMNEYITLCRQTLNEGRDFTLCNVHTNERLTEYPFNRAYIQEKLGCMLGREIKLVEYNYRKSS